MKRILLVAAVLLVAVVAIRHPAPQAVISAQAAPSQAPMRHSAHRSSAATGTSALVYVAGAVRRAGLYRVRAGARVNDAVAAAGGLAPNADPVGVNLAARIADGDEIAVPRLGERIVGSARGRGGTLRRASARSTRRSTKSVAVVDLNRADADQLARVPGIGRVIAERIVALRAREGPYGTLDELLDVAGMTPSRLDRAGSYLRI